MTLYTLPAAALAIAASALYVYVGLLFLRRPAKEAHHRPGLVAFASWWLSLAAFTLTGAASGLLYLGGVQDLFVHRGLVWLGVLPLTVALGSIVTYFAYLTTGRRGAIHATVAAYAVVYVLLVLVFSYMEPTGVSLGSGRVQLEYENQLPRTIGVGLLIALLAPPVFGAFTYARLYFHVEDLTSRYRIALVSASFAVWFGLTIIVSLLHLNTSPWWGVMSQGIAFAASLLVLAAYRPPAWVRRRLGVKALAPRADAKDGSPSRSPAHR